MAEIRAFRHPAHDMCDWACGSVFEKGLLMIRDLIEEFFCQVLSQDISIYNEISFQLELGIFLRKKFYKKCENRYTIEFERNIKDVVPDASSNLKKEIDIILKNNKRNKYEIAIELKFPRNGQFPNQMFESCKDIKFLEQLAQKGIRKGYFLFFTELYEFYSSDGIRNRIRKTDGIYAYFRKGKILKNKISKPTKNKTKKVVLDYAYEIK